MIIAVTLCLFISILNFLLLLAVVGWMKKTASESDRFNHILVKCEEIRKDLIAASPNDIWGAKKYYKADTSHDDLVSSYNGLMEATVKNIRLANEAIVYMPKTQRKLLFERVMKLNECAADANQCMNYSQLEASGEERVDELRQALSTLRQDLQAALEHILYVDADSRTKKLDFSKPNSEKQERDPNLVQP